MLSKREKDLLDLARRPRRRCFLQLCDGVIALVMLGVWSYGLEGMWYVSSYDGTPQAVTRLAQILPLR